MSERMRTDEGAPLHDVQGERVVRATPQPIVLVGGRSERFGRDKLREPVSADGLEWMVDRPIRALREVFGACVAVVGNCDPAVAARADHAIRDRYPGTGPAGGVLAALEHYGTDVFVLAGDLPNVTASAVRTLLDAAAATSSAAGVWVVLASSNGVQPCIGLYRQAVRVHLAERVHGGNGRLFDLAPPGRLLLVPIPEQEVVNVNVNVNDAGTLPGG